MFRYEILLIIREMAKISRKLLLLVLFFVVIHFLKDITQDILKIPTFLDLFGNANEDLSNLPKAFRLAFVGTGYISFLAEIFLMIAIPLVLRNKRQEKLEKVVWITIILLAIFFITATLLDPRYSFWH